MANFLPLLQYLQFLLSWVTISRCSLLPYGKNVKTRYEGYHAKEKTSVKVLTFTTTCSNTCRAKFLFWCTKRQGVCRNIYYYHWKTVYKWTRRTRPVYSCKIGWKPNNRECTIPICTGGCQNGGVCISPNNCRCSTGWRGNLCESDINECKTSQNRCGYKPGCINTPGSYTCSCSLGFELTRGQLGCRDIDECFTYPHPCGRNSKCVNTYGSYSCPCVSGYTITPPRTACEDIDECNPRSGFVHGCQMQCNNFVGGYNCKCDDGYYITSNGKDCSDHDECTGNAHGCGQNCSNLPGGYKCTCLVGYRLNSKDLKTCNDINECSENISGCAHHCKNTIGGFECSCNRGYQLGDDLKQCIDVIECSKPVDYCQHKCLNTPGSYRCICRPGFYLHLDGKSCIGRPCFPIHEPINGMMNCSGRHTEDSCNFECLAGYDLSGSIKRNCGPNKEWTGSITECKIVHCASPREPSNGFVYSPCSNQYGSQCSIGCDHGYFADSKTITCTSNRIWEPRNYSCHEIKVCEPNPCIHGGKCSIVGIDQYACDCSLTGYSGTNCEVGFFQISNYPIVSPNILSPPVSIVSSPPSDYVILHLLSQDLHFSPSSLVFNRKSLNQSVSIAAQEEGFYVIRYSLSGPSAREFVVPEDDIIFVQFQENLSKGKQALFFPVGCYKKLVGKCPVSNVSIIASSTSPFVTFGPLSITQGVVAIEVGDSTKIPLSILGVNLENPSVPFSTPDLCDDNDVTSFTTESLVQSRTLTKSYTSAIAESLPEWLKVTSTDKNFDKKIYASEMKTHFLTGQELRGSGVGEGLPILDDMFYSLLFARNINVTIQKDLDIFKSNSLSLAVELCQEPPMNILLQPSLKQQIGKWSKISFLEEIKRYGWHFEFFSLQFSRKSTIKRPVKGRFWDGQHFFNVGATSDATFAAVASFKKNFRNSSFCEVTMQFDGTLIGRVDDVNQIIHSPLEQHWDVDLFGQIVLKIVYEIGGKVEILMFNGSESVGNANFGGNIHRDEYHRKGLYFTATIDEDLFLNSSLSSFVGLSSDRNISCFLNTTLYEDKTNFYYTEKTESLNCAFRGTLKVGALTFSSTMLTFQIGKENRSPGNSIKVTARLADSQNETFGIFKRYAGICQNVQISFGQNMPKYEGSFCAICNMLGIEKLVNVRITHEELKFQLSGKLFRLYDANMNCSIRVLAWKNQVFNIEGRFEEAIKETSLVDMLQKEVDESANKFILQATKRLEEADLAVKRAHIRLEKVLFLREQVLDEILQLANQYTFIVRNYEISHQRLESLTIDARKHSKHVKKLKSDVDSVCIVKQCHKVCRNGTFCTTCNEYITANAMGMCPATCFKTEQRLVPPYFEIAQCTQEKCKRIHNTNGFFKSLFGEKIAKWVKVGISTGIGLIATAFRAPPAVAGALGNGITTFLDTGRLDETLCATVTGFVGGWIAGKGPLSVFKKYFKANKNLALPNTAIAVYRGRVGSAVKKALTCQRDQKDGKWECKPKKIQCRKDRYEYEYIQSPYGCHKSCVIETIKRAVEKTCCRHVSCASFVINITCVAENIRCKNARLDVLTKLSNTNLNAKDTLENLEYARSNFSYWKMQKQKLYGALMRKQRWLNTTQKTIQSLEKAYNITIEHKQEMDNLFSAPLKLKSLLTKRMTSVDGMKIKEIHFKTKVFPQNDNTLLPIDITYKVNDLQRQLSTVLDFERFNSSLKSISEEILNEILRNGFGNFRKKRSANIPWPESDTRLFPMKKYHRYCARFRNYHHILYTVASSLYNLSSSAFSVQKELSQTDIPSVNITTLLANSKPASNETVTYDFEMYKLAMELQDVKMQENYEAVNFTNKIILYNWFASMEEIFNISRLSDECNGMNDCMVHILGALVQMFSATEANETYHLEQQIKDLKSQVFNLSNKFDMTIDEAMKLSSEMLTILKKMAELTTVCAKSPNITKHPDPMTEVGVGKVLMLECQATGTALIFSWTFNGQVLTDQKSNVMTIQNTTTSNSGKYICLVSNHIAKERSTTATVIIHSPPVIIRQPVDYLSVVLFEDDFLHFEVEDASQNISYQWWFKSSKMPSFFTPLWNETFSYLNFSPMKVEDEGWYFCNVSNPYGATSTRTSLVKAMLFTLPVPTAVLSFTMNIDKSKNNSNASWTSSPGYDAIRFQILRHMKSEKYFSSGVHVQQLNPINCVIGKSKTNNVSVNICSWELQCIGTNTTSNITLHNDFKINAGLVMNASEQVSETVEKFVNATNNGLFSFSVAGIMYVIVRNSISVQRLSLICPGNQMLVQRDFKCVDCPPGYHAVLDKDHSAVCIPCPLGYYQSEGGKTTCNQCPKGYTTWHEGSYEHGQCKVDCPAGHHAVLGKDHTASCKPCPLGYYQTERGKMTCIQCPKGYTTSEKGSYEHAQCKDVEATETPNKITVTTRKVVPDEIDRIADDDSDTYLLFGLLIGVLFIVFIAIVITILIIRRRRTSAYKLYIRRKRKITVESPVFNNVVYKDPHICGY